MESNDSQSFPDWIEDAYESLHGEIAEKQDGIPRDRAIEFLVNDDSFHSDDADADYAIRRLLNSGWLYEVNDEIRVTEPDD